MAYLTRIQVGSKTDAGKVRDQNEDFLLAPDSTTGDPEVLKRMGRLYIVADGMGGHVAGRDASERAVWAINTAYQQHCGDSPNPDISSALTQAIQEANKEINSNAEVEGKRGMGTTVVCAVVRGAELYIAHVGDSRAYLLQDNQLTRLTRDHSWVAEQVAENKMTEEEARSSPDRNVILRALGPKPEVQPDVSGPHTLKAGDLLLLCTDGVWGEIEDDQIENFLQANVRDSQRAADYLIGAAKLAGAKDNATAIVVRMERVSEGMPAADRSRPLVLMPSVIALIIGALCCGGFVGLAAGIGLMSKSGSAARSPAPAPTTSIPQPTWTTSMQIVTRTILITITESTQPPTVVPADTPLPTPTVALEASPTTESTSTNTPLPMSKYVQIPAGVPNLPGGSPPTYFLDDGNGAVEFIPPLASSDGLKGWNDTRSFGLNGGMHWTYKSAKATASWRMDVPLPVGVYAVYIFVPSQNSTALVTYHVITNDNEISAQDKTAQTIDQNRYSNNWVSIGLYRLSSPSVLHVSVSTTDIQGPYPAVSLGIDALGIEQRP
jgi:protein phosphatase